MRWYEEDDSVRNSFLMSVQCVQADVFVFSFAYFDNRVNVIDPDTNTLVASIAVGAGHRA